MHACVRVSDRVDERLRDFTWSMSFAHLSSSKLAFINLPNSFISNLSSFMLHEPTQWRGTRSVGHVRRVEGFRWEVDGGSLVVEVDFVVDLLD